MDMETKLEYVTDMRDELEATDVPSEAWNGAVGDIMVECRNHHDAIVKFSLRLGDTIKVKGYHGSDEPGKMHPDVGGSLILEVRGDAFKEYDDLVPELVRELKETERSLRQYITPSGRPP